MTNDRSRRQRRITVLALMGVVGCMVALVSFSVPLYRLFCSATGFGGTTQRVAADTAKVSDRVVTVRFDTSVVPGMPWRFEPVQRQVQVHLGEQKLVYFTAHNLSDHPIVGHATFNVTPYKAGPYFNKIQCFCFDEERLDAGETATMPVEFYVDPGLAADVNASEVDTITLAYTFLPSASPDGAKDLSRFEAEAPTTDAAANGKALFAARCAACHALDRNKAGPTLAGILGRPAGTAAGYPYSDAVRKSGVLWSAPNLDRWLADPGKMIPGTRMPVRVTDAAARAAIIAYLRQAGPSPSPTQASPTQARPAQAGAPAPAAPPAS